MNEKLVIGLAAGMMLGSVATAFAAEDIVYEGTAYLPVREIGKLTGYNVSFNEQTQTIELANVTAATSSIPAKTQDPGARFGRIGIGWRMG
ncbi:stalk domain-containing protein [Paenibacillus elgii]